jgi:hypothetical protein
VSDHVTAEPEVREQPRDETPSRSPRLPPVAYPLLGLVFGAILVFSFSRILLAVSKDAAPVIALLVAPEHPGGGGPGGLREPSPSPARVLPPPARGRRGDHHRGARGMQLPEKTTETEGPTAQAVTLVAQGTAFSRRPWP